MKALTDAPPPTSPLPSGLVLVAVMYFFIAAMVAALTLFAFIAPAFDDYYEYSPRGVLGSVVSGSVAIISGLTGFGLLRRNPRARTAAITLSVALVAVAVWLTLDVTVFTPSDHGSEVAYVLMGGVMYIAAGVAATVVLVRPSAKECFRPPPGGWYADPVGEARWRVWDGQQWTRCVA